MSAASTLLPRQLTKSLKPHFFPITPPLKTRIVSCEIGRTSGNHSSSIEMLACRSVNRHTPQYRSFSSKNIGGVLVPPPPSWSVEELRLTSSISDDNEDEKISEEELATLARRCLIDVRRLTPERRNQLRVDVAGIMRCASVLLDAKSVSGSDVGDLTDEQIYDAPRGLGKLPIRRDVVVGGKNQYGGDESGANSKNERDWESHDSGESKAVMGGVSVKGKMVDADGEKFFSVVTKG